MKKYKCLLCGQEFEIEEGQEVICPLCGATGDEIVPVEDEPEAKANPYAGTQTEKNLQAAFAGESQASE